MTGRKILRAILAAALTLAAGVAVAAPEPAHVLEPVAAITYGPMAAPNGVGQPAWYRASEWNGAEPVQYGSTDWWITAAPADSTPDLKRRSEIKVGSSQEAATIYGPGLKTQWKGYLKPVLGAAKNDGRSWHSLVQLHGPDTDGAWTYSQVALRVENGYWRLWGDDGSNVNAWSIPLLPYVDDYATYATITYRPEYGTSQVCVTLDPAWSVALGDPPAQSWCHDAEPWDSQWLVWHAGLYRGSGNTPFDQGGLQPTYEQHVYVKAPVVTVY